MKDSILIREISRLCKKLNELNDIVGTEVDKMAKNISKTSDLKREFIAESIVNLAKFDYRIEFLGWYIRTKQNQIDDA